MNPKSSHLFSKKRRPSRALNPSFFHLHICTSAYLHIIIPLFLFPTEANSWGFYAHREINQLAVYTLPGEMAVFYKQHIKELREGATRPDQRRFSLKEEACRHFIDLEYYSTGDSCIAVGLKEEDALLLFPLDSMNRHGRLPWHLQYMRYVLIKAFKQGDREAVIRISAECGHYIADACVPLHTTKNYNGQYTGQHGIHGLWESRLPELFEKDYHYWVGPAEYFSNFSDVIWEIILSSHQAKDSVLSLERDLNKRFRPERKYSWELRGQQLIKVISPEYAQEYHLLLNGMVEERMQLAVKTIGSFWYSCWKDAGEPRLEEMKDLYTLPADTLSATVVEERDCH